MTFSIHKISALLVLSSKEGFKLIAGDGLKKLETELDDAEHETKLDDEEDEIFIAFLSLCSKCIFLWFAVAACCFNA